MGAQHPFLTVSKCGEDQVQEQNMGFFTWLPHYAYFFRSGKITNDGIYCNIYFKDVLVVSRFD